MELFYPCDRVIGNGESLNPQLPIDEIQELNEQMNCNLYASDEDELYFNKDTFPVHVSLLKYSSCVIQNVRCTK